MRIASFLLLSCLFCAVSPEICAAPSQDAAVAMSLYNEGRTLAEKKRFAEALEKFQASQRLNPTLKAHYEIANCLEKLGRTASAWSHFLLLADESLVAGQRERAEFSKAQAKRLEPKLVRLTIRVSKALPGMQVMRGDATVSAAELGTAVPVDPGKIRISAGAPGHEDFSREIELSEDNLQPEIVIPALEPSQRPAAPSSAPRRTNPVAASEPPATPHDSGSSWGTQRVIGAGLFGAGLVSAVVGGYFGLRAIQLDQDAKGEQDSKRRDELNDDRFAKGDVSTGFFIAAGVLAIGGGVLYFTAPDAAQQAAVQLGPRQARLLWGTSW